MRFRESVRLLLPALLAVALMTGCVSASFVYKPSAPVARGTKLPMKIAVLPFTDGTEDFTRRGSFTNKNIPLEYNLAKAGSSTMITALTPELWAKGFADELAASGSFQASRFLYSRAELTDEDFLVEGTLNKAYWWAGRDKPSEFALTLRALRRVDNVPLWEKRVERTWKLSPSLYDGCWGLPQCVRDRYHAYINRTMQSLLAEAGADLAAAMASTFGLGSPAGEELLPPSIPPATLAPESVNETIESILKGK